MAKEFIPQYVPIMFIIAALAALFLYSLYRSHMNRKTALRLMPSLLRPEWAQGVRLRQILAEHGIRMSGPAFHSMMAEIVDNGVAWHREIREDTAGSVIAYNQYRLPVPIEPPNGPDGKPVTWDEDHRRFYTAYNEIFTSELHSLLRLYPGEFVAIAHGEIVDHMPDEQQLSKRMSVRYPKSFHIIRRVPRTDESENSAILATGLETVKPRR